MDNAAPILTRVSAAGAIEDRNRKPAKLRTRTLPDQIADHVAAAILNGEYKDGAHVSEQSIALSFSVSNGPVREAIRALARRGLVEFRPRRGAFVVAVTLDSIADIFNVRAALLSLAAHSLAMMPADRKRVAELRACLADLRELAADQDVNPTLFSQAIGRLGNVIYHACDNAHLKLLLHEEATGSLWRHLWRTQALDFSTKRRRRESVTDWSLIVDAIVAGRGPKASMLMRKVLFDSRDEVLATLQRQRREKVASSRFVRD